MTIPALRRPASRRNDWPRMQPWSRSRPAVALREDHQLDVGGGRARHRRVHRPRRCRAISPALEVPSVHRGHRGADDLHGAFHGPAPIRLGSEPGRPPRAPIRAARTAPAVGRRSRRPPRAPLRPSVVGDGRGHLRAAVPATRWRSNALAGMPYIEDIHAVPRRDARSAIVVDRDEQDHCRRDRVPGRPARSTSLARRSTAPPYSAGSRKSGIQPSPRLAALLQRGLRGATDPDRARAVRAAAFGTGPDQPAPPPARSTTSRWSSPIPASSRRPRVW